MSTPTTPVSTPVGGGSAPATSASGAGDLLKSWGITAALMGLLYAYLQGNVESPWLKVVYQGFPIAVAMSFLTRVITGGRWCKLATYAMIAWGISIVPQVWLGMDEMIGSALTAQNEHLGAAYDRAKNKAYLNRAADLSPSLAEAREEVFKSTLNMEFNTADKFKNRLAELDKMFKEGKDAQGDAYGLERYEADLKKLYPRLAIGDRIHREAMRQVKGPEAEERPKIAPRLWGVPHVVLLAFALFLTYFSYHSAHGGLAQLAAVAVGGITALYIFGTGAWPELTSGGLSLPDFDWTMPNIVFGLMALFIIALALPSKGGSHHA